LKKKSAAFISFHFCVRCLGDANLSHLGPLGFVRKCNNWPNKARSMFWFDRLAFRLYVSVCLCLSRIYGQTPWPIFMVFDFCKSETITFITLALLELNVRGFGNPLIFLCTWQCLAQIFILKGSPNKRGVLFEELLVKRCVSLVGKYYKHINLHPKKFLEIMPSFYKYLASMWPFPFPFLLFFYELSSLQLSDF